MEASACDFSFIESDFDFCSWQDEFALDWFEKGFVCARWIRDGFAFDEFDMDIGGIAHRLDSNHCVCLVQQTSFVIRERTSSSKLRWRHNQKSTHDEIETTGLWFYLPIELFISWMKKDSVVLNVNQSRQGSSSEGEDKEINEFKCFWIPEFHDSENEKNWQKLGEVLCQPNS